jgi:hypothetical protein
MTMIPKKRKNKMSKQKIKDAILDATGNPQVGWVAENADFLSQKIAEALGLIEAPKAATPVTPVAAPVINKAN